MWQAHTLVTHTSHLTPALDAVEQTGDTALMLAARHGHTEVAAQLLVRQADVNQRNRTGMTALMWAARFGHTMTVATLLEHGAETNHQEDKKGGYSALMWTAKQSDVATMNELLLSQAADPDLQARDVSCGGVQQCAGGGLCFEVQYNVTPLLLPTPDRSHRGLLR